MTDVMERLLNPGVLAGMVVAGAFYGGLFLWALDIRDSVRLYAVAVIPGLAFLGLIFGIRLWQGVNTTVYTAMSVDWLVFANVAFVSVLVRRMWAGRM